MKQKLGQHFLINPAAITKIVAALNLKSGDTIIEIGPGRGALTWPILEECKKIGCKLIAIEKDPSLAYSIERLAFRNNIKIITGDALRELSKIAKRLTLTANRFKVVGNIPYYITGKLLRILGELKNKPQFVVLMLQKEVAERICAQPPRMNLLAAAVQFWAEPKILFSLKPSDFNPSPEVRSAVITLYLKPSTLNPKKYYQMLHVIFKQPRKTLVNNLWIGLKSAGWRTKGEVENALKKAGLDPFCRPQNLSLKAIELLTTLF